MNEFLKKVRKLYRTIGCRYTKKVKAGKDIYRPSNKLKWKFAKEQCKTNKRICSNCNNKITVGRTGELVKCCDKIMKAQLPPPDKDDPQSLSEGMQAHHPKVPSGGVYENPQAFREYQRGLGESPRRQDEVLDEIRQDQPNPSFVNRPYNPSEPNIEEWHPHKWSGGQRNSDSVMKKELPDEDVDVTVKEEDPKLNENKIKRYENPESEKIPDDLKNRTKELLDKLDKYHVSHKLEAKLVQDEEEPQETYWVIKKGKKPLYRVAVKDIYNDPTHPAVLRRFRSNKYGRNLVGVAKKFGLSTMNEKLFDGKGYVFGQANQIAPDFQASEPIIEDEGEDAEPGDRPRDPQAERSLVDQEAGDELLQDKVDKHEVLELLSDALVPIIVAAGGEVEPDDLVAEIQALAQNPDAFAEWKGRLEEKVHSTSETAKEVADSAGKHEISEAHVAGQPQSPPPTQQPMATAPVAQSKAAAKLRDQMMRLSDELAEASNERDNIREKLEAVFKKARKLEAKNKELRHENEMLLRERELRLITPRAKKLAQKMVDVGITPADQINQQEKLLLHMDSNDFLSKEAEVNRIHAKMNESRKFEASKSNYQIQGALPVISTQSKEDSGLGPNRKRLAGSGERLFDWS